MSASEESERAAVQRPGLAAGGSAGDAMLRRRFARQLGVAAAEGAEAPDPYTRAPARPQRTPPVGPALGPPRARAAEPPPRQRPAPRPQPELSEAADPLAELEAEPQAAPSSGAPRSRNLEEEFLAAFSEDPPYAPPAGEEDFLSEYAREPAPAAPPPPKPVEAPSLSGGRRSLSDEAAAAAESGSLHKGGARRGSAAASSPLPSGAGASDGKKRSREFALNFDRLRKFGFITPTARRSRLSEEIRLIKRRLIRRMTLAEATPNRRGIGRAKAPRGRQHVILFTSAKPSEGKSFVAVNLALSIILDEGLNVLLVDADAARPSLSRILGLKQNLKGLTDLLEEARHGRSDVSGRMLRTPDHPLTFIPAGEAVESATDLYGGDAMRSLMADLADRYSDRIILIDGPPLLASTEPVELARHAGQVVMVVDAERTTRKAVEAALDLLGPECNVNLVLNKATATGRLEQFGSYYEAYANDSAPRKS